MKVLFIGDIVSRLGRKAVREIIPTLKKEEGIDLVLANAENLAGGRGVTEKTLYEMLEAGIDYFTSGNHVFYQDGWEDLLENESYRLLRPANYPPEVPGKGTTLVETRQGKNVFLVNLMGKTFFGPSTSRTLSCPFDTLDRALEDPAVKQAQAIVVDLHAEATSEKKALGFYADGKVSLLVGTHTHVPTCDQRILPKGTAYVTDVGMTGPLNSVLGVKKEIIWDYLRYPDPQHFQWVKEGEATLNSVLVETKGKKSSESVERRDFILETP